MIDLGRKKDLEMLMTVVNNESEPLFRRRRAYRMVQSIRSKMSDPVILRLRLRLIAASQNDNHVEIEKIGERIEEYEKRNHLMRKF